MSNSAHLELETIEHGLRFAVTAGSGQSTTTDSGKEMQAPSPIELRLIALAACHAMDVIEILRKKRQRVTAYAVDISGERRAEHPRSFTSIEVVHRLRGHEISAIAVESAIRLSETKYCSVHASLDPKIAMTSRFEILPA